MCWGGIVSPWCPHGVASCPLGVPMEPCHVPIHPRDLWKAPTGTPGGGAQVPLWLLTPLFLCPRVCPQREHLLKQFLVQSRGFFNTSAMPYRVQPRVLPAGEAEVQLSRSGGE